MMKNAPTDTKAPTMPPMASPMNWAFGSVFRRAPALKSCRASPAMAAAMAATAATYTPAGDPGSAKIFTKSRTMMPKISIGSMPVWPVMAAAMEVTTQTPRMRRMDGTRGMPAMPTRAATITAAVMPSQGRRTRTSPVAPENTGPKMSLARGRMLLTRMPMPAPMIMPMPAEFLKASAAPRSANQPCATPTGMRKK